MKWLNEISKRFHKVRIGPDHWTNKFKRYTAKTFDGDNFQSDSIIEASEFLTSFDDKANLRQTDPLKWFLAYGAASVVQDVSMFANSVWYSLKIFHSNYFKSKIHCLPCGDDVPIGIYQDIDVRIESALYRLVVNYVEYELDGIIWHSNEHAELTNAYHWIKVVRPAMLSKLQDMVNDPISKWEEYLELEKRLQNLDDHYLRIIVNIRRTMWT